MMNTVEIDFAKIAKLIMDNDVEDLKALLYAGHDPSTYVCAGGQMRQVLTMIALSEQSGSDLLKLGLDIVLPWVDIPSLCEMLEVTPGLTIINRVLTKDEQEWADDVIMNADVSKLSDVELCLVLSRLYHTPQLLVDLLSDKTAMDLVLCAYNQSLRPDVDQFFRSGRWALLAFAQLIPDLGFTSKFLYLRRDFNADVTSDDEAGGGWLPDDAVMGDNADMTSDRVKPPYAAD